MYIYVDVIVNFGLNDFDSFGTAQIIPMKTTDGQVELILTTLDLTPAKCVEFKSNVLVVC